jgi:hypothetical protein
MEVDEKEKRKEKKRVDVLRAEIIKEYQAQLFLKESPEVIEQKLENLFKGSVSVEQCRFYLALRSLLRVINEHTNKSIIDFALRQRVVSARNLYLAVHKAISASMIYSRDYPIITPLIQSITTCVSDPTPKNLTKLEALIANQDSAVLANPLKAENKGNTAESLHGSDSISPVPGVDEESKEGSYEFQWRESEESEAKVKSESEQDIRFQLKKPEKLVKSEKDIRSEHLYNNLCSRKDDVYDLVYKFYKPGKTVKDKKDIKDHIYDLCLGFFTVALGGLMVAISIASLGPTLGMSSVMAWVGYGIMAGGALKCLSAGDKIREKLIKVAPKDEIDEYSFLSVFFRQAKSFVGVAPEAGLSPKP